jgi:DNA-binding response OmpR family regulator
VKAILRRSTKPAPGAGDLIRVGEALAIDPGRHSVLVNGNAVELTSTEFSILLILGRNPGWVFTREKILDALWGDEKDVIDRTIDVHIKHMREKLGPAGSLIKNIRGVGYKIEP